MKVVGEKVIMPFLPDLEELKMAKIKECCEKAVISGKPAGGTKPKVAPAAKEPAKAEPPKRPGPVIKKPAPGSTSSSAAAKKPAPKGVKKQGSSASKVEEKIEKELSPEEVEEKAAAILPADVISGLVDANWKARLAAMESFNQVKKKLITFLFGLINMYQFNRRLVSWNETISQLKSWLGRCARSRALKITTFR